MATLLISVLLNHGQQLLYIPGLAVNRASVGYRGTGKTDAKDATAIACPLGPDAPRPDRSAAGRRAQKVTAQVILTLAKEVMGLNEQISEIDKLITARFREHELAEVISSMPGIGPLLGAVFLAATAGDMSRFGNVSGNLHRPRRYHRGLQRVFYTSALISIRSCDASRRFYERKRAEGERHTQAVLALARRRVNVLWALIRDGRYYQRELPVTAAA